MAKFSTAPPGGDIHRRDRHEVYIGVLVALWFAGIGILAAPFTQGAIAALPAVTQDLLAVCIIVGSTLALIGSALGPGGNRILRWFMARFSVRHAYLFGAGGLIAVNVGLGWFGWAILTNGSLVGTATGSLTPILFVVYMRLMWVFWKEYRHQAAEYKAIKAAVLADEEPQ